DHGHVAAADRHDKRPAEDEREREEDGEGDQRDLRRAGDGEEHAGRDHGGEQGDVDRVLAGEAHGSAADKLGELGEGIDRAGEGDAADQHGQENHGRGEHRVAGKLGEVGVPAGGADLAVFGPADQQRGEAAEAVEQGDHLGHGGHFHGAGADDADGGAGDQAGDDPGVVDDVVIEQRHHQRQQHADGGEGVAAASGGLAAEHLE